MTRPTYLQIDIAALHHNLKRIRELTPRTHLMAMVKANAYGHGLVEVAQALDNADAFGVAFLEEALTLRAAGIKQPIVVLEGFFNASELNLMCEHNLESVVHQYSQLEILEQYQLAKPLTVWLKIDTGLHRLGFLPEDVTTVWQRLVNCRNVQGEPRLLSHFADPDQLEKPTTLQQLNCFNNSVEEIAAPRSLASSAAILAWPDTHYEWVRPGIMLYGVSPFADKVGLDHGLKPVMTLRSELIVVRVIQRGAAVGYGGTWISPDAMLMGVVAIGYGDGYTRHAESGTPVLVNGKVVPIIGRVSMDLVCVDLRSQPDAKVGDPVVLWGEGLPVEVIARHADTIPYELLCDVSQRVRREVLNNP